MWKTRRSLQVGFNKDKIKRGLMLPRETPWSKLPVEQAHGSTASTHNVIALRWILHMSRALLLLDAEDRCVMHLQKVIERLRRKRPRKMSVRQAYFRELLLEVIAVSRSAPHSSQALKEKITAQHVKLFNAFSPSDKQGKHARNIEQDAQLNVDAINLVKTRAQAQRAVSGLMQCVSMVLSEYNEMAELFGLWQTPAFSRPNVESLRRKFSVSPRPPPKEVQDALQDESSVVAIVVVES